MTSNAGLDFEKIAGHRLYPAVLISLFFLMLAGCFLAWPIVMYDTDLWYHLSGGRYFWQNATIPADAFFSFIAPPKSWYNYYWLFQAFIYKIFQWAGYNGLVILRGLLYVLTAFFIYLFFRPRNENRTERLLGLFWFVCCTLVIMNRELLVRPHLFSYLFIVVFLYILEHRRDRIWLLPLLGILWSNLHGIEYPVMFLIVFAYLAETYWRQYRGTPTGDGPGSRSKWLLISVFYTIFLTPGAIELVQTPFSVSFQNAAHQHLYVAELLPFNFRNLFVFAPVSTRGLLASMQNLVVIAAVLFVLMGLWKRNLRISHAILFAGALLLLTRHLRFTYEFTLLSIPLLGFGARLVAESIRFPERFADLALPVGVVLFPALIFSGAFGNRPTYPFSESNLPAGNVRFLNRHAPGGNILNEPNTGGYLPWALGDKFKIYMDMQMTIFSDTDFATAHNAFSDANVFRAFVRRYDPSFISVSLNRPDFKKIAAPDGRFTPVFFDSAELLYVNRNHYKELAEKFGLKAIDPFQLREIRYGELDEQTLALLFAEAERVRNEDPTNYNANSILCNISVVRRQYDPAVSYAEDIIRHYPELSQGYALKADALFGRESYQEAARLYEKAMDMGQTAKAENVYWNLHASYVKLKAYKKAYRLLARYVNPFVPATDYKEIYSLGISAASAGKIREARTFLTVARMKAPETDAEYVKKIEDNLLALGED
jgi:tetratricopeptide (TPR) repeat protein